MAANLSYPSIGQYVAHVQSRVAGIRAQIESIFDGNGNLHMRNRDIDNAANITCSVLHYTSLDPPVSSDDNITGPGLATDTAIVRFDGASGRQVSSSNMALSNDGKLMQNGNMIDMSVSGVIDLSAMNPRANGSPIVVTSAGTVTDSDIVVWDSSTGRIIKTSGVAVSAIAGKLSLSGGTMIGPLDMGSQPITNMTAIIGTIKTSSVDEIVTSTASSTADSDIVVFNSTTGKIIKTSGVAISAIASKVSKAGDSMIGPLNMTTNNIINIGSIAGSVKTCNPNDIVTTTAGTTIDSNIVIWDATSGNIVKDSGIPVSLIADKLPLSGGTMTGPINMGGFNITNTTTIAGTIKTSAIDEIVTSTASSASDSDIVIFDSTTGKIVKASGVPVSIIANKLSLSGGTMLGSIAMGGNNITNAGSISGSIKTSDVNELVTSAASSVVDSDIVVWDSTTGKIVKTSGVAVSSVASKLPLAGGTMAGSIAMGGNNISNVGALSGSANSRAVDDIVSNASTSITGNVVVFSDTTGKVISDSGESLSQYLSLAGGTMSGVIAMGGNNITNIGTLSGGTNSRTADNIVSNVGASVAGNVSIFSDITGKVIADSGASLSQYLPLVGGTMAGAIAMGGNNITNIGTLSGGTNSRAADNIVSNAAGSVSGNVVTFSGTTGKVITDSGASLSQYLPLAGGTMSGNITMNGNSIIDALTIYQTTPSALSIWSSDAVSTSFTANTPRTVTITNFTSAANPNGDFTVNTSTGQCTYTGSSTRYFNVTIDYSYTQASPLTTQTLTLYISKNGSTTINGKRKVVTFVLSNLGSIASDSICDVIQLANGNTLQLGGQYTSTASLTISNVSYAIAQI